VGRAVKNIYLRQQGSVEYSGSYSSMSYYEDIVSGMLVRQFMQRPVTYTLDLIKQLSQSNKTYIVHEHVSIVPEAWLAKLIEHSDQVVYLKRTARKEQVASRIIAGYTGVYIVKDNYMLCHGVDTKTDLYLKEKFEESIASEQLVRDLMDIYTAADLRMQNVNTVIYEDLPKQTTNAKKLFGSSFDRLCRQDQQLIDYVLQDYGL
jgi:hypothetical protein